MPPRDMFIHVGTSLCGGIEIGFDASEIALFTGTSIAITCIGMRKGWTFSECAVASAACIGATVAIVFTHAYLRNGWQRA